MASFIRRFLSDPGNEVLLQIESINILDLEPPSAISGVGTGTAMVVGEFENGPFKSPTQVGGPEDLKQMFGSFGYQYAGVVANNPCARSRLADSAIVPEYWNGNAIAQLSGKRFASLVVCRVDTSVGSVSFTRRASVSGLAKPTYSVVTADTLSFDIGAGAVTTTFTAAAAVMTGSGATYAIVGGETVTVNVDTAAGFALTFTATFLSTDTTVAAVVARINQYAGFTLASNSAGQVRMTGRQLGTGGKVQVVSFDAGGTAAKLGLTVSTQSGTGNVSNSKAVTFAELKTLVEAAVAGTLVDQTSAGLPRVAATAAASITVAAPTTATDFGFVVGTTSSTTAGNVGTIPAGTVVRSSVPIKYVTMQDVTVTAANAGPYSVKVRHATDDGTGVGSGAGAITIVDAATPIDLDAYSVNNLTPTTNALTEAAIDAAYSDAFDSTLDVNTVSKEVNIAWSARQSNATRRKVRDNVKAASANGCFGRFGCVRPPLGTSKAVAKGAAEPGVGPYRDQRVAYNYPGVRTLLPIMAKVGLSGGAGFSVDGVLDVGSDGFLASVLSQLPPEENPGQDAGLLDNVISVESSPNAQGYTIVDYTAFKNAGICAPRMDAGVASFQSGVTSVDPSVFPSLVNIARRRMADFIQDTLANRLKGFGKKLNTVRRRTAILSEVRSFLKGLSGDVNGTGQRIAAYATDTKSGNTAQTLGQGIYRIKILIQTLSSLDSIVLQTTIGEEVDVSEAA